MAAPAPERSYIRIKLLSLGEMGVGKSCLIKRYCEQKFVPRYIATIGVDFGVRSVNVEDGTGGPAQEVKVNFWDLSGDPDFLDVRNEFTPDTQGAIFVYDVTDRKSFAMLDEWHSEFVRNNGYPIVTVLAANKVDETSKRQVSEAEGRRWAEDRDMKYFETSAKTGQEVNNMFSVLVHGIASHVKAKARSVG